MKMLHVEQYYRAGKMLDHFGWRLTNIKLPENKSELPIRESIWRFDNQKLGYFCFLELEKLNRKLSSQTFDNLIRERNAAIVDYVKSVELANPSEVLTLIVISETGHGRIFLDAQVER